MLLQHFDVESAAAGLRKEIAFMECVFLSEASFPLHAYEGSMYFSSLG
jgi:hypothetical protein